MIFLDVYDDNYFTAVDNEMQNIDNNMDLFIEYEPNAESDDVDMSSLTECDFNIENNAVVNSETQFLHECNDLTLDNQTPYNTDTEWNVEYDNSNNNVQVVSLYNIFTLTCEIVFINKNECCVYFRVMVKMMHHTIQI